MCVLIIFPLRVIRKNASPLLIASLLLPSDQSLVTIQITVRSYHSGKRIYCKGRVYYFTTFEM